MAEITLKSERPALIVNVGDEQYRIPLTFTRTEFEKMGSEKEPDKAICWFFSKYLGDVFDALGDDDYMTLIKAWAKAREEHGMPDLGEAQASRDS